MAFAGRQVLTDLSFQVERGSVVGFLGPNGAGKSTTMRLLTGFLQPAAGRIGICGYDSRKQRRRVQSCIGYLPESPGGFGQLTVTEFLLFCGQARGLSRADTLAAVEHYGQSVDLHAALTTPLRMLSKGWRQRVWLAQALLHDPPVLILDEPTDGLDPLQKRQIHTLIRQLAPAKSILFSTHRLDEAEQLCDRLIVIAGGRIQADAATATLADARGRLSDAFDRLTSAH